MNIGDLRHLMIVEKPTGRVDGNGATINPNEYAPLFEVWCSLKPLTNAERDKAAAVQHVTTHKVECHYHPDLTGECRLKYGNRIFNITSIINKDEMNVEYNLMVNEILDG